MQHIEKRAIQRSDKVPKKKQMYGFQIATDKRTWYFAVKEESDREEWIKTLVMLYHAPYHIKVLFVIFLRYFIQTNQSYFMKCFI